MSWLGPRRQREKDHPSDAVGLAAGTPWSIMPSIQLGCEVMAHGKMHDNELEIDQSLVAELVRLQFPAWAHLVLVPVPSSGTDNMLWRLGADMVVRLPRIRPTAEDDFGAQDVEHTWLLRLAPRLPVPVPVPLAKGEPACGYPWRWSICPWLQGETPQIGQLTHPRLLARDLAGFMAALHQIDSAGGPSGSRGGPLRERDKETRAAIAELRGLIDTGAAIRAWEEALSCPQWQGPPVWLHADLSPGNVLVDGGRLAAVIDFGMMGTGDPACDLLVAWNLLPSSARGVFRRGLGVDEATWGRGRGWALSVALLQLPYYRQRNPDLAANARHVIKEVLADHRRTARSRR